MILGCEPTPPSIHVARNIEFTAALLGKLRPSPSGNLVVCPHGLSRIVDLIAAGATGATLDEIESIRGPFLRPSMLRQPIDWSSKTRAWVGANVVVHDRYAEDAQRMQCSITSGLDPVEMRAWSAKELDRPLASLIDWNLPGDAGLAIIDVSRFIGTWAEPFALESTKPEEFHCASGEVISVPMMQGSRRCGYFSTDAWESACVSYSDPDVCALILLPRAHVLPNALLADTGANVIQEALGAVERDVELALPRFDFTGDLDPRAALTAMGMRRAWTDDAELGAISDTPLFVGSIQQAASVRTDEEGTRAESVTVTRLRALGYADSEPAPVVRADRPFLFLVAHRSARTILFAAMVGDPRETSIHPKSD